MSQSTFYESSPASSPPPVIDSSPPTSPERSSSPWLPPDDHILDPYAGKQKATRRPRSYERDRNRERKPRRYSGSLDGPRKRRRFDAPSSPVAAGDEDEDDEDTYYAGPGDTSMEMNTLAEDEEPEDPEDALWDATMNRVMFETVDPRIDLSNKGITKISSRICELQNFVSIPEEHAPKTREIARSLSRAQSASQVSGMPSGSIFLYLRQNLISILPAELFDVEKLAVLSLQNNEIRVIPPEIRFLVNLREFNLSFNKIKFLPAEMQSMNIPVLRAVNNPFILPPDDPQAPCVEHPFGRTVTPLVELCMRKLVAEDNRLHRPESIPEQFYSAYHNCVRQYPSIPAVGDNYDGVNRIGDCRCGNEFVLPMEERTTWEVIIAGCSMDQPVPLRWRACTIGCLDTPTVTAEDEEEAMESVDLQGLRDGWGEDDGEGVWE
ncbi:hypothetical protein CYLTODRAFT_453630 [Cylindrobasidium torrendii FP15055 ss-10]|uniref:L domain-like protein n=1 Tax=Cylindrobasidium torrendii FP15055 ss-10 TaxID=1314674 RepID=A0A0D7BFH5_9AGAR|nr:hypothetical protein CYLTODRAFT_453630 [Cylindrobasidium torrendii FP15055 ss-10]